MGTSIGTTAAIVPLTIGSAPFIARLIESALLEVDSGVIEAAKSFGASKTQIIFRVMFVEALPSIIGAITLTLIVIIGFTAMAGCRRWWARRRGNPLRLSALPPRYNGIYSRDPDRARADNPKHRKFTL